MFLYIMRRLHYSLVVGCIDSYTLFVRVPIYWLGRFMLYETTLVQIEALFN
jgi:Mg/Co/Ni transporter MgtE